MRVCSNHDGWLTGTTTVFSGEEEVPDVRGQEGAMPVWRQTIVVGVLERMNGTEGVQRSH